MTIKAPKLKPSHIVVLDALGKLRRLGITEVTPAEVAEVVRAAGHESYGEQNVTTALGALERKHHRVRRLGARWELRP